MYCFYTKKFMWEPSVWCLEVNINPCYGMFGEKSKCIYFFMMPDQFDLHKDHNYASLNSKLKQMKMNHLSLTHYMILSSANAGINTVLMEEEQPWFFQNYGRIGGVPVLPSHCFMGMGEYVTP